MSLRNIEIELLRHLPRLDLRPTLDAAIEAGRLLVRAREYVPHGEWLQFLKRVNLTQRTAHDYQACYTHAGDKRPAATMTIKAFLLHVRRVNSWKKPPSGSGPGRRWRHSGGRSTTIAFS